MPLNFPDPNIATTYEYSGKTYIWTGTYWALENTIPIGYTGSNGYAGSNGYTGSRGTMNWSLKTSIYQLQDTDSIIADTSGGSFTVYLPESPSVGSIVEITDGASWETNPLTVARNLTSLETIEGISDDFILNISGIRVEFIYDGTTWQVLTNIGKQGDIGYTGFIGSQGTLGYAGSQGPEGVIPSTFNTDISFTGAVAEQVYDLTTEGATPSLDASNGTIQTQTIAADTTYTDSLLSGEYITLMTVDATGYVITWPTGTSWVGGSGPTLATTGYSVIEFWKVGTTLYAAYVGDVA